MRLALATAGLLAVIFALAVLPGANDPRTEPAVRLAAPQPVSAAEARALLAHGALLADVREPNELAETGKLKGAINLPVTRLAQQVADGRIAPELAAARDRPVVLYCRSGRRAQRAGEMLVAQGFSRVYNLGGFEDAVKAGLPAG